MGFELFKNKCCIAGVGKSPQGKLPQYTPQALGIIAAKRAIEDAGLTIKDIDGVISETPLFGAGLGWTGKMAQTMNIVPSLACTLEAGGATCTAAIHYAVMAIVAGRAKNVLCLFCDSYSQPLQDKWQPATGHGEQFDMPYGINAPGTWWALGYRRYMHDYGYDTMPLAHVAVACRKHANLNPEAQMYSKKLTLEDHQNEPYIFDPLRKFDFCQVTDGGSAVVVTSAERAKDLPHRPVYISGWGQSCSQELTFRREPGMDPGAGIMAGKEAFRTSGLTPKDVDVVELYDGFTPLVLHSLESFGFCKPGEAGAFVKGGRIELGGELPLNTHGGLLSEAYMPGWNHIIEGVRQLRGDCGERQVKDAEVVFTSGYGGDAHWLYINYGTLILTRR